MIEKLGTDPWGNTAERLPALNDTLWEPAYLSDMDYAYCPAYAINAIITEADVRIKKMVQTFFFPAMWQWMFVVPILEKTRVRIHFKKHDTHNFRW